MVMMQNNTIEFGTIVRHWKLQMLEQLHWTKIGKNVHTPPEFWSSGQDTPWTFIVANLLLKLHITTKSILSLVSIKTLTESSHVISCELKKYQIQVLNQLKNLENFGLVEREGVSETIRQELPLPEFSSLSWSQPLCPYSALWSREAVESHHCYCPCLATVFFFFFFFPAMFFKSSMCESLLECHGFTIYLIVVASALVSMYAKIHCF